MLFSVSLSAVSRCLSLRLLFSLSSTYIHKHTNMKQYAQSVKMGHPSTASLDIGDTCATHLHTHTPTHTHTYAHMHTRTHTHTHTHIHIYTYTHAKKRTHTQERTHTYTNRPIRAVNQHGGILHQRPHMHNTPTHYTPIHTPIHTNKHTHTHTRTNTHTHT